MTLSLTVLGCAATFPRPDNPSSGYLIRTEHTAIWVDCGSGTFAALQRYLRPHELSAVWISHLHPDHSADLLSLFNWAINSPTAQRLPVYGPPRWAERLAAMLPSNNAARLLEQAFEVHSLHDGHSAEVGDIALLTRAMQHSVPAFGLQATNNGRTIAYSGDTGPCPALIDLASGTDLFVCEAGAATPERAHCTVTDALSAAEQGSSRRLLLTHLGEGVDTTRLSAQADGPPVAIAVPGMKIVLDE